MPRPTVQIRRAPTSSISTNSTAITEIFTILLSHPLFFFNDTATTEIYTLSLHDALPISTRLRPPRTRTRRARRPTNTNGEFGMGKAESQWDVTRHDPHPDIPHPPFRIPHFGLTRRLHPDDHPPRLPARPACSHRRSRRPTGAGHHRARQPGGGREPRGRACERARRLRRDGVVRPEGASHPPPRARDHEPRRHREDPVLGRSVGARSNPAHHRAGVPAPLRPVTPRARSRGDRVEGARGLQDRAAVRG